MDINKLGIPVAIIMFWVVAGSFMSRFYIGVNPSSVSCLNTSVLLVDKQDQDVKRGDIAAFVMYDNIRHLNKGDRIAKIVAGIPGDTIRFDRNSLYVNDIPFQRTADMKPMLAFFEHTLGQYKTEYVLGEDEYFMVGETVQSFDSRYWGPIKKSQLVGQAYAVY